eukprot:scaffold1084_cov250-Ochromonas_danica.AAC.8
MKEALSILVNDLIEVNYAYYSTSFSNDGEFWLRWCVFAVVTIISVLAAALILSQTSPTPNALLYALRFIIVPLLLFIPIILPSKAFRLFLAVLNFLFAMNIVTASATACEKKNNKKLDDIKNTTQLTFLDRLTSILFLNIRIRVIGINYSSLSIPPPVCPSLPQATFGFFLLAIGDICNFLSGEWIPVHISQSNRNMAIALVGSMWILCALEFAYWFIATMGLITGWRMGKHMYHNNPLLALSISEFWGVRWNPLLGKELQTAFYKPVRKLGFSRPVAVLACFAGSALLHAFPKTLSSFNWIEAAMMFSFFVLQGGLLIVEAYVKKVYQGLVEKLKWSILPTFPDVSKHEEADESDLEDHLDSSRGRFAMEVLFVLTIWSAWYHIFEIGWTPLAVIIHIIVLVAFLFYLVQVRLSFPAERIAFEKNRLVATIGIVMRWLLTLSCILPMMPLFTLPMMSAVDQWGCCSLVVAPLIRTIQKVAFIHYGCF